MTNTLISCLSSQPPEDLIFG